MRVPHDASLLLLLLLAVAIVLPPYLGIYYTRFATQIAIYGMAALSVDLLLGYTGLITFGQAASVRRRRLRRRHADGLGVTNAFVAWPLADSHLDAVRAGDRRRCRCAPAASSSSW